MRDTIITLGLWLALDRILVWTASSIIKSTHLTVDDCLNLLRRIAEIEFPHLTDMFQLVTTVEKRDELIERFRERLNEIEVSILAEVKMTPRNFQDAIISLDDPRLSILNEEIRHMVRTAINGQRELPQMPASLGYPNELSPEDQAAIFELIGILNSRYRVIILKIIEENFQNCRASLPGPSAIEDSYQLNLPQPLQKLLRLKLSQVRSITLQEHGMTQTEYLHSIAVLSNSPVTGGKIRLLHKCHSEILLRQLQQLKVNAENELNDSEEPLVQKILFQR